MIGRWWRRWRAARSAAVAPSRAANDEAADAADDDAVVTLPVTDALDLHAFAPRGRGVQRERVHALLRRHPLVATYRLAPAERGGWGATMVVLRADG